MRQLLTILILAACHSAWALAEQSVKNVSARSFIVTELDGTVLLERASSQARPIASITKLLVAEQVSHHLAASQLITIKQSDLASSYTKIKEGELVSEQELLAAALIASNNSAIIALSRIHGTAFVIDAVNNSAATRGLRTIHIDEPSGLSARNVASAADLAKFAALVIESSISKISVTGTASTPSHTLNSTNPLLFKDGWNFLVSKTGWTAAAGGCLLAVVEVAQRPVIFVILGSTNVHTRWQDLMTLRAAVSSDKFWTGSPHAVSKSKLKLSHIKHRRKK